MANLEAIGNPHQAVPLLDDAKPVVHEPESEAAQPVEKGKKKPTGGGETESKACHPTEAAQRTCTPQLR